MMQHSLTELQSRAMQVIKTTIKEKGTAPTQQEISDSLGLSSKSQVNRLLKQLEDRGYISRMPGRHRAIAVMPNDRDVREAANDFVSIQENFRREYDQDQVSLATKNLAQQVTTAFDRLRNIVRGEA
jgi:SOS-response transcriptional repressor LexA